MQSIHPTVSEFSKLYQRQRGFHASMVSEIRDEQGQEILNDRELIMDLNIRVSRKLPSLTPEILLRIAKRFGVDVCSEPFLLRVICLTIDDLVKRNFDLGFLFSDMQGPIAAIRDIDTRKVKEDIVRKPESIIMCQECEKRSSVLKCEQCMDHFCQECFDMLHATGNRKLHLVHEVEQLVCVACDIKVAECQCIQCGSFFCNPCFGSIHGARPELHKHRRRVISGLVCQECEHAHAGVICEDCCDLFCSACFLKLHKTGKKESHAHLTADANGQVFRGGLLIAQSEADEIINRSRQTLFSNKWIPFKNDREEIFWYDFTTSTSSTETP